MAAVTMPSFMMLIVVAAGGAIGAVIRYLVSIWVGAGLFGISGPLATLAVNIAGCGLMGVWWFLKKSLESVLECSENP